MKPPVNLSRIYCDSYTLGLILTYAVNFRMSSRETAALMREVHGVKISHETVLNYMAAAAFWVKPFVDNFDYELSSCICGDETYVKVLGKWHYVFFIFDAVKRYLRLCLAAIGEANP